MPTTDSSNHPHVRITPDAHQRIRLLSRQTGFSQGDLVDIMTISWLSVLKNPEVIPPRQSTVRKSAVAEVPKPRTARTAPEPTPPPARRRAEKVQPPTPTVAPPDKKQPTPAAKRGRK